ncbi:MAG: MmgE/PrpD family protein [Alphaproteobacteria bacterium]|nr:MmgE/PrpD family protein [Alphaproteobacteria bacterium]
MVSITKLFGSYGAKCKLNDFNDEMKFFTKMSILDWCGVAYAAKKEPVSRIVSEMVMEEKGVNQATVISSGHRVSSRGAALANGATGHALDYDDTHFLFVGHPTSSALPTALALGEELNSSIEDILLAYMAGVEVSTRIGHILGYSHYNAGFHQTATSGSFGSTIVASKLLGLSEDQTINALGLVSTRASGIKSQFGTMGKPFHAGMAASNGIEAAKLSKLGFISRDDGIECEQGFFQTHGWNKEIPPRAIEGLGAEFLFPEIKYKFHACCHGLHSFLEALDELKQVNNFNPETIEKIEIETNPSWLKVCNIEKPKTGLESKFSYKLTAAMSIFGKDTSSLDTYDDTICFNDQMNEIRDKVKVIPNENLTNTQSVISIKDGSSEINNKHDLSDNIEKNILETKIVSKSASLLSKAKSEQIEKILNEPKVNQVSTLVGCMVS